MDEESAEKPCLSLTSSYYATGNWITVLSEWGFTCPPVFYKTWALDSAPWTLTLSLTWLLHSLVTLPISSHLLRIPSHIYSISRLDLTPRISFLMYKWHGLFLNPPCTSSKILSMVPRRIIFIFFLQLDLKSLSGFISWICNKVSNVFQYFVELMPIPSIQFMPNFWKTFPWRFYLIFSDLLIVLHSTVEAKHNKGSLFAWD